MPLLGTGAMLLSFDIAAEAIAAHDDWHTHEHLHERLSIPGFLRGTRWIALRGAPRYMVLYEVAALATLTSPAYLDRLNNPSAWTTRTMPHYRGMRRGLCAVTASLGFGLGHVGALLRFAPRAGEDEALRRLLRDDVLPSLPATPGLGSAHLLEAAAPPPMTREQKIRGADAQVDWALLVTGYEEAAVEGAVGERVMPRIERHVADGIVSATYRIDYMLSRSELR